MDKLTHCLIFRGGEGGKEAEREERGRRNKDERFLKTSFRLTLTMVAIMVTKIYFKILSKLIIFVKVKL